MEKRQALGKEEAGAHRKPGKSRAARQPATARPDPPGLAGLQQRVGNRAVQRLIAQGSGAGRRELDDETTARINRQRGGGAPLDSAIGAQAGAALGRDFGGVRVHTSPEADSLSRQLGARAFTTGRDVFFRQGAYDPHSSSGQELIGHELTHVVQQGAGAVSSGSRMAMNPPGDAFEQEADGVAKAVAGAGAMLSAQRQEMPEEEELQMQEEEEEEVQMQEEEEEEEMLQSKPEDRGEEHLGS